MKCNEFQEWLPLYAGSEVTADEQRKIEWHLDNCESCRQEAVRYQELRHVLATAREEVVSPELWADMWYGIRDGLRQAQVKNRLLRFGWALQMAAVLVFGIGIGLFGYFVLQSPTVVEQKEEAAAMTAGIPPSLVNEVRAVMKGVEVKPVDEKMIVNCNLPTELARAQNWAYVANVAKQSPAEQIGLKKGDIIANVAYGAQSPVAADKKGYARLDSSTTGVTITLQVLSYEGQQYVVETKPIVISTGKRVSVFVRPGGAIQPPPGELEKNQLEAFQRRQKFEVQYLQGYKLQCEKKYKEALEIYEKIVNQFPREAWSNARLAYNIACCCALMGNTQKALSWVKASVLLGNDAFEWLEKDPDLASLRAEPEFQQILKSKGKVSLSAPPKRPEKPNGELQKTDK